MEVINEYSNTTRVIAIGKSHRMDGILQADKVETEQSHRSYCIFHHTVPIFNQATVTSKKPVRHDFN